MSWGLIEDQTLKFGVISPPGIGPLPCSLTPEVMLFKALLLVVFYFTTVRSLAPGKLVELENS